MDPDHALYLTAHRLARRLTGHGDRCGCEECTLYGKLLGSDKGLRLAVQTVCEVTDQHRLDNLVLEALTGETL